MAKRKRLTPANPAFLDPVPETAPAFAAPLRAAPIADVARDASASAAAEELARTLTEARESGRMVVQVPLTEIAVDYLVRDRIAADDDEMAALRDSLRARGQQMPVDLVALPGGGYGLISGWRRCAALKALHDETGEARFAEVLGLLRQPGEQAEAYLSMVEENEIRVGLSFFERARIVVKSVEGGVFDSDRAALQTLFQSASRPKRSKIGSFLPVVRALDGALRFPEALTERLGLRLSKALGEDPGLAARLRARLGTGGDSAEAETALIEAALAPNPVPAEPQQVAQAGTEPPARPAPAKPKPVVGGIALTRDAGRRIVLEGYAVDDRLEQRLITWLRQNF